MPRVAFLTSGAAVALGVGLMFTSAGFLGALIVIGGVMGLGWSVFPASVNAIARFLSVGMFSRRR